MLGQHEMDDLLAQRDKLNADIQRILDQNTEAWGIKVSNVEIKQVDLDESMIRAMAKQAEAERTRRAKIIHAEGEAQAAEKLVVAAQALARDPRAMQLRYLQTLADISNEKTSTIVFPLPLDLIRPLLEVRTSCRDELRAIDARVGASGHGVVGRPRMSSSARDILATAGVLLALARVGRPWHACVACTAGAR